jgi:hypothetical protein
MGQEPTPTGEVVAPPATPDNSPPVDPAPIDPVTPPTPDSQPTVFDETYVKQLRSENANHRIKNKELQEALEAYQRKERSDLENLTNDVTKYRGDIDNLKRENQKLLVQVEAAKLGIVDPEAASLLLDWSAIDTGKPVNEALADLLDSRPWLKQVQQTQAPTTPPVQTPTTPTPPANPANPANPDKHEGKKRYTKGELDAMSQAQMAAELDDVLYAMEHGLVDLSR